jgi:hypothetical protein
MMKFAKNGLAAAMLLGFAHLALAAPATIVKLRTHSLKPRLQ